MLSRVFALILGRPEKLVAAVTEDPVRFALFVGGLTGGYKGLNCLFRKIRGKDDFWNAFLAGGLSALSMLVDSKSRRKELALYVVARAVEAAFNSAVLRGWVRPIPHGETILFALFCGVIMYSFAYEPDNLPSGYYRWISKFTGGDDYLLYQLRGVRALNEQAATATTAAASSS